MKKNILWGFSLKYTGGFVVGALLLCAFSIVQKNILGLPFSLDPSAFFIPVLFGGFSGLAFSVIYVRLRTSREEMKDLLNNIDDIVQVLDEGGNFTFVNNAWYQTLGYSKAEIKKINIFHLISPAKREECKYFLEEVFSSNGETKTYETVFISEDGRKVYLEGKINCRLENGKAVSTRTIFRDITERHKARKVQQIVAGIFEKTQEGVAITDSKKRISFVNNAFTEITGYSEKEALGVNIHDLLIDLENNAVAPSNVKSSLSKNEYWHGEIWSQRKNKEKYPLEITINAITDAEKEITNYACIFSDISKRKANEIHLKHLASHDGLTDLPNRETFYERTENLILEAEEQKSQFAILFLDLDGFKDINDQYGHHSGDVLLKLIAQRLKNRTRGKDIVARFGGDEFIILLSQIQSVEDAKKTARGILRKLEEPYNLGGISIQITASIGISLYAGNAQIDMLLIEADKAMYEAKRLGKNQVYFIEK